MIPWKTSPGPTDRLRWQSLLRSEVSLFRFNLRGRWKQLRPSTQYDSASKQRTNLNGPCPTYGLAFRGLQSERILDASSFSTSSHPYTSQGWRDDIPKDSWYKIYAEPTWPTRLETGSFRRPAQRSERVQESQMQGSSFLCLRRSLG